MSDVAVEKVNPRDGGVSALLDRASREPVIVQTQQDGDFAVLPLDDEVLDLLLERSPRLAEECTQIRERMQKGQYLSHDQALAALEEG